MKKHGSSLLALLLAASLFTGCGSAVNLTAGIRPTEMQICQSGDEGHAAVTDFALNLFLHGAEEGENTLISPLSVFAALSLCAGGAAGNTLTQMEAVLGMPAVSLAGWFHNYAASKSDDDPLHLANSVWFADKDSFTVNEDFLRYSADYFHADIFRAPFDSSTCREINGWVKDETDGMIRDILDKIPEDAVMYLVNALAFEAEWQKIYKKNQIRTGDFTASDGSVIRTDFMYSDENRYLEDDHAAGFLKYYDGRKYAFAALLPEKGMSPEEYLQTLDGAGLHAMLTSPRTISVDAAIPKFSMEYDTEMSEILKAMGMTDAFDGDIADFSGLGSSTDGNLVITRVLHKTRIDVDAKGTKAGAATVVEVVAETAAMEPPEVKTVHLDRPFVYMLIECETGIPLFIGTMNRIDT